MISIYKSKYLKYKNKYLNLKKIFDEITKGTVNQIGGKIGDFYDYTNDREIKKLFFVKNTETLNIFWSLRRKIHTSRIKKMVKFNDNYLWITESGSVYYTKKPIVYDIFPALTKYDNLK